MHSNFQVSSFSHNSLASAVPEIRGVTKFKSGPPSPLCGKIRTHVYHNVSLATGSVHPKQHLFRHFCTAKPRWAAWQTDWQTLRTLVTIGCISCIRCSLTIQSLFFITISNQRLTEIYFHFVIVVVALFASVCSLELRLEVDARGKLRCYVSSGFIQYRLQTVLPLIIYWRIDDERFLFF